MLHSLNLMAQVVNIGKSHFDQCLRLNDPNFTVPPISLQCLSELSSLEQGCSYLSPSNKTFSISSFTQVESTSSSSYFFTVHDYLLYCDVCSGD